MQEARGERDGIREAGNFIICSSKAIRGQFGCEIWFNKVVSIGKLKGEDVYYKMRMVEIVVSKPRVLGVRVNTPLGTYVVVSFHS